MTMIIVMISIVMMSMGMMRMVMMSMVMTMIMMKVMNLSKMPGIDVTDVRMMFMTTMANLIPFLTPPNDQHLVNTC